MKYIELPRQIGKTFKISMEKINHPEHYNQTDIEVIDVIESYELNFSLGNSVKYLLRCGLKHEDIAEDIHKAIWYLKRSLKNTIPTVRPKFPIPTRKVLANRVLPVEVENALFCLLRGLGTTDKDRYKTIAEDAISSAILELEKYDKL
jgi:hypothetical protein